MWIFIGVVILGIIVVSFLKKTTNYHVATMFIANYNQAIESGKSQEEALESAITFFSYRYPFNGLSDNDRKNILSIALTLNDPLLLATIYQHCEAKRNVDILRNYPALERLLRIEDEKRKTASNFP